MGTSGSGGNNSGGALQSVMELTVNLDDLSGQVLGDVQERLLEAGALDVWTTPIGMKKQRPGVMLSMLCPTGRQEEFARLIVQLTGSFGVRFCTRERLTLARRHETVSTAHGQLRIKVGSLNGQIVVVRPEYEDVKALADSSGKPLRKMMEEANAAAQAWHVAHQGEEK